MIRAAGILYVTPQPDQRVLLVRRAMGQFPNTWAFPGGRIEDGESAEEAARREAREELGPAAPDGALRQWMRQVGHGVDYTTFMQVVPEPFEPTLNDEHTAHEWLPVADLAALWGEEANQAELPEDQLGQVVSVADSGRAQKLDEAAARAASLAKRWKD